MLLINQQIQKNDSNKNEVFQNHINQNFNISKTNVVSEQRNKENSIEDDIQCDFNDQIIENNNISFKKIEKPRTLSLCNQFKIKTMNRQI